MFSEPARKKAVLGVIFPILFMGAGPAAAAPKEEGARSLIHEQPFLPATMSEAGKAFASALANRVDVIGDRFEYWSDDLNGQFLVMFFGKVKPEEAAVRVIQLELKQADAKTALETKTITPVTGPKLPVLISMEPLKPGRYELIARLLDKSGDPDLASGEGKILEQASRSFTRSDKKAAQAPFPSNGIAIQVHRQSHVPDGAWPITTGVPMPKGLLMDTEGLALLENGKPVPAQFITRATWSPTGHGQDHPGKGGYVKWVGVDFIAKYDKGEPREYRLVNDPSKRVAPSQPLTVQETDEKILVNTGAIQFEINRKKFAGIEKAWVNHPSQGGPARDGKLVVDGTGGSFVVDEQFRRFDSARDSEVKVRSR